MSTVKLLSDSDIFKSIVNPLVSNEISFHTDLAGLKSMTNDKPLYVLASGNVSYIYYYRTGDYSAILDDVNVVALTDTPATQGALIRQDATSINFFNPGRPVVRSVHDRLSDTLSVKDFGNVGLVGIGQYIPLSSAGFATLAQAQVKYPFVTALTQSLDYAAFQAALNAAAPGGGCVFVPAGRYLFNTSVAIPSNVEIRGDSRSTTVIDNQYLGLNAPQFVNQDPVAFYRVTIRNLSSYGGTHFLKVNCTSTTPGAATVSACRFEGILTNGQSVSDFQFNRLETSTFKDCELMSGGTGFRIDTAFPTNSNTFVNMRFVDGGAGLRIQGGENNLFLGGSFEAGGKPGGVSITLTTGGSYIRNIVFSNYYFESGSPIVLRCPDATTGVKLDYCHFTGQDSNGTGSFHPYSFDCGNSIIELSSLDTQAGLNLLDTVAPANVLASGFNNGLVGTNSNVYTRWSRMGGQVRGKSRAFKDTLAPFNALHFSRASSGAAQNNQQLISGKLKIWMTGFTATGGYPRAAHAEYLVTVYAPPADVVQIYLELIQAYDGSANTFVLSATQGANSGTDAYLAIAFSGGNGAGLSQGAWAFEFDQTTYDDTAVMSITLP